MSATPYGASVREFREDARSEPGLSLAILRIDPLLLLGTLGLVAAGIYVIGTATDTELVNRLGLAQSKYEGPTGIVGVLHTACIEAGLPSASLWASVPHYVAAASNPKAALALLRGVEGLVGVSVDVSQLESAAADYERQVGLAVQSDPDIQAFVERLEQATASEQATPSQVPSGDVLAREFQRFLRQRGRDVR